MNNIDPIFIAPLFLAAGGILFAFFLALSDKFLSVREDPKVAMIEKVLPGLNCGACGSPSCSAYAQDLVSGKAKVGACTSAGPEAISFLNTLFEGAEQAEKKVAVLKCAGGSNAKFSYSGIKTCVSAELIYGGPLDCSYGCLGMGDCVAVCPVGAMAIGNEGIVVIDHSKCTGCGLCVAECPRGILELIFVSRKHYVACGSRDKAEVRGYCKNGCFACGICAGSKFNPDGVVVMIENIPVVLEEKFKDPEQLKLAGSKCPVKVWKEI